MNEKNIAIDGKGTIDLSGSSFMDFQEHLISSKSYLSLIKSSLKRQNVIQFTDQINPYSSIIVKIFV